MRAALQLGRGREDFFSPAIRHVHCIEPMHVLLEGEIGRNPLHRLWVVPLASHLLRRSFIVLVPECEARQTRVLLNVLHAAKRLLTVRVEVATVVDIGGVHYVVGLQLRVVVISVQLRRQLRLLLDESLIAVL